MGGQGQQWLIVRNEKGQQMLDLLGDAVLLSRPTDSGDRRSAVRGFIKNTQRAAGGLPLRRMPVAACRPSDDLVWSQGHGVCPRAH